MTDPVGDAATAQPAPRTLPVYGMFFLSGMGALVFENVWFSQTGLIVGNTVWSAALTVGAFMAGLALGNALAANLAWRWRNLVRSYGLLELVAASSGVALVLAFPFLPMLFGPLLAPFLDHTAVLNLVRSGIAFVLMVIPAAALGTTLPLLSKPLEAATGSYGLALGRLYGINTLGAVAGTLLAELVLIPAIGLRSSGLFAATCNLGEALIALRIAAHPAFAQAISRFHITRLDFESRRIVVAAFLAGGVFLALEVIWFRFLLLYLQGTSLIFAVMLAVVLAGIGVGGVLASRLLQRAAGPARLARLAAAGTAIGVVAGFGLLDPVWTALAGQSESARAVWASLFLMGPVSLFSGVLFTALGELLRARIADAAATTGVLALANTLGGVAGSLLAAFVLLPGLGMERSFFVLAALYVVMAATIPVGGARWQRLAPLAVAALVLAVFPFGRLEQTVKPRVEQFYGARVVAMREGVVETSFYLQNDFLGAPLDYQLVTNAYSMSGTALRGQRYMRLFAYLPAALHPKIEHALLICFGVGNTARALAELPDVKTIDIADVSRDILELSPIAKPPGQPHVLDDPRVSVHIEDGRFFLQQTPKRFDLITGEPPPPKMAGMASLYSREYFELLRSRLNPGGIATYWLPVLQLDYRESYAIIHAFCDAFEDCSLWAGAEFHWILMGSNGGLGRVSREHVAHLWDVPRVASGLRSIGLEVPEQLAAQFMADAGQLRARTAEVAPVTDDFPKRISPDLHITGQGLLTDWLANVGNARAAFATSPWIAQLFPAALVADADRWFYFRALGDLALYPGNEMADTNPWGNLATVLRSTPLVNLPRWMLDSEAGKIAIAAQHDPGDPVVAEHLAIDALARRSAPIPTDPAAFAAMTPKAQLVTIFRECLAGQLTAAHALMASVPQALRADELHASFFDWAARECVAGG
ncbi:MAG TPA: fused MFS/spermidine synthase [Solimonas sp.]|nr:fused MFS/spermidine synthase [Solimonas sp.]